MQRRTKILIIVLVVGMAGGATYFFRKRGPAAADDPSPAQQSAVERSDVEKPAPQSHLLGEIQSTNLPASNGDLTPVAPATNAAPSAATANPFAAQQSASIGPPLQSGGGAGGPASAANGSSFGSSANPFAGAAIGGATEVLRHKVVDGDTLTALAERYLGSANRYLELYEMNRDKLASPDLLPIGAELKVPARGLVAPPIAPDAPQPMVPVAPAG